MTRRAIDDVLDYSQSRYADRLVLIALASHANDDRFAWPGIAKIMRRAAVGRSTAWHSLRRLCLSGEIVQHDGPVPGREHDVASITYRIIVAGSGLAPDDEDDASLQDLDSKASEDAEPPLQDLDSKQVLGTVASPGSTQLSPGSTQLSPDPGLTYRRTVIEPNGTVNAEAGAVAPVEVNLDQSVNGVPSAEEERRLALVDSVRAAVADCSTAQRARILEAVGWKLERDGLPGVWIQTLPTAKLTALKKIARSAQRQPSATEGTTT